MGFSVQQDNAISFPHASTAHHSPLRLAHRPCTGVMLVVSVLLSLAGPSSPLQFEIECVHPQCRVGLLLSPDCTLEIVVSGYCSVDDGSLAAMKESGLWASLCVAIECGTVVSEKAAEFAVRSKAHEST